MNVQAEESPAPVTYKNKQPTGYGVSKVTTTYPPFKHDVTEWAQILKPNGYFDYFHRASLVDYKFFLRNDEVIIVID